MPLVDFKTQVTPEPFESCAGGLRLFKRHHRCNGTQVSNGVTFGTDFTWGGPFDAGGLGLGMGANIAVELVGKVDPDAVTPRSCQPATCETFERGLVAHPASRRHNANKGTLIRTNTQTLWGTRSRTQADSSPPNARDEPNLDRS